MRIKLAIIADTHLDYSQWGHASRRKDFLYALSHTVDQMIAARVNAILHTGDLFNSNRPSSESVIGLQAIHERLIGAKTFMYVVPGNHDYTVPSWLELLRPSDVGGIQQIDNGRCVTVGDVVIKGYESMSRDQLVQRFADADMKGVDCLALHMLVKEYIGYPPPNALSVQDIPNGFQLVALGDIHVHDIRTRPCGGYIGYPGSTELCSTSEADEKFWLEVDFEDRKIKQMTKRAIKSRPVWRWDIKTEADVTTLIDGVDAKLEALRKTEVRNPIVVVKFPTTLADVLPRIRAKLNPDNFIILEDPEFVEVKVEGLTPEAQVVEDCTIDDVLRMLVPANDPLYGIASQLLNPDIDGKIAVNTYVEQRLKEIDAPTVA
jgi:DNA repair exonuclease SbcCD nuclease subunit